MSKTKIITSVFFAVVATLALNAFFVEPNIIDINEIEISDTGTEMKIGLIADFQRRNSDPLFVQSVVDIMNEKELDVVLIAGDFIDKSLEELPSVEPIKRLETKYGTYGVLGNHDYNVYFLNRDNSDLELADKVIEYVESDGTVKILRNESVKVNNVNIIGLDSYWAGLRDEQKAFANTADGFKILLAHNQNDLEIDKETADLYTFGHTHCGQIRLPYIGSLPKIMGFEGEYDYRGYVVNDAHVYTTCGLSPGPRLFNLPEVTIITLLQ